MCVIELVRFSVKQSITEEHLQSLSVDFEKSLKKYAPGFIQRTLAKDIASNVWIELIWWDSIDAAHSALDIITKTSEFDRYCSALVDDGGNDIEYFKLLSRKLDGVY